MHVSKILYLKVFWDNSKEKKPQLNLFLLSVKFNENNNWENTIIPKKIWFINPRRFINRNRALR